MSQTIFITGGAGFIGSHLADRYASRGDTVIILDDLSTGNIRNLASIRALPNVRVVIDDVCNRPVVAELVDQADIVFHLAAAVGVRLVVESPVYTIENNVHGTEVILAAANKKKKKVVLASTSEVYGCSNAIPFRENDFLLLGSPDKGRWAYACSKLIDEFLALAYFHERRLPVVIARLFNTVGPRQTGRYGMVLPNFVRQALTNQDITVFGDGSQSRCFAHVQDVIWALEKLADAPEAVGQVFNIGSQEEISILDLAKKVKALARSTSAIVFIPYEQAYAASFEDMPRRVPDTSRLQHLTGFTPKHNLDYIISSVIDYISMAHPETALHAGGD